MSSIESRVKEVVEEFSAYANWEDRYKSVIALGKELEAFPEAQRLEENKVKGCQSQVWLDGQLVDGKIIFTADSDAIITKGIIALLIRVVSNQTPDEILNNELFFIDQIGLKEHLSPTRANGLVSMIKQIKMYAIALQAK